MRAVRWLVAVLLGLSFTAGAPALQASAAPSPTPTRKAGAKLKNLHNRILASTNHAGGQVEVEVSGTAGSHTQPASGPVVQGQPGRSSGRADPDAAIRAQMELALCELGNAAARPAADPLAPCRFAPNAAPNPATGPGPGAPPVIDPGAAARAALLRLPIPMPEAKIGPHPSLNEWNMAAVGYPLWLWIDGPDEHRATITEQGITITLTAHRISTGFDLGDGTRTWCGLTPAWHPGVEPGRPSPGCGHVYKQPSLPDGTYQVTATTAWTVEWSALGQTGTLPFERTGPPTELPVGELIAVRTR